MTFVTTLGDITYEECSHTGDIALKVWAPTPEELYASSLLALTRILLGSPSNELLTGEEIVTISVESPVREERLVMLLQDYLYKAMTENFFATGAQVTDDPERGTTQARIQGTTKLNIDEHPVNEIKGVTFHRTRFEKIQTGDGDGDGSGGKVGTGGGGEHRDQWFSYLVLDT